MRIMASLLLLVITGSAYAEVYKCQSATKQLVYQSTPCSADTENQGTVKIEKLDARQLEEAEKRLKATEAERQALDKAEQARREAAAAQWKADAPQREAAAARKAAEAAAKQQINTPYPVYIPYPAYNNWQYNQMPAYNPNYSPYPSTNPDFSPYPRSPYPPPYMTLPSPVR
jgi:hypothetical protein